MVDCKLLDESEAERGQVETDTGESIRLYKYNGNYYPSVTSILNHRENPEKKMMIKEWKDKQDDADKSLRFYQARGTYFHYLAQDKYAERDMWGEEETQAVIDLWQMDGEWFQTFLTDQQGYSKNSYENALYLAESQAETWVKAIHEALDNDIEKIHHVEKYVFSDFPRYAGQADLIYETKNGETVITDLKTSKYISYEYYLQAEAYASAITRAENTELQIDAIQIARAKPSQETEATLFKINSGQPAIYPADITKDKEWITIASPYEAKNDIKDLVKPVRQWEPESNKWKIRSNSIDYAISELRKDGWTVKLTNKMADEIKAEVDSEINLDEPENKHKDWRSHLRSEFEDISKKYNKTLKIPEDFNGD